MPRGHLVRRALAQLDAHRRRYPAVLTDHRGLPSASPRSIVTLADEKYGRALQGRLQGQQMLLAIVRRRA
jgi:hypothetical protein